MKFTILSWLQVEWLVHRRFDAPLNLRSDLLLLHDLLRPDDYAVEEVVTSCKGFEKTLLSQQVGRNQLVQKFRTETAMQMACVSILTIFHE